MIWKKSGAGSSFKLLAALAALAVLVLAAGFLAPSFLLRLALDRFAAEPDFNFTYERAEAGPFFRSASVFGPALTDPLTGGRLRADYLIATDLKPLNFFRPQPGDFLAATLTLRKPQGEWDGVAYAAERLIAIDPRWPGPEGPLPLFGLWLTDLRVAARDEWHLSLDNFIATWDADAAFEAGPFAAQFLAHLTLTASSLKAELNGRPAGRLKTLKFTTPTSRRDGRLSLDLALEPEALAALGPFWADLADLTAGAALYLNLSASSETTQGRPHCSWLENMVLAGPGLGRLEMEILLEAPPDALPASLDAQETRTATLAAILGARLVRAALSFQDGGFMAKYYAHLARTEFQDAPGRPVPDLIRERWLDPLVRRLENEAALREPAGLAAEAEAFLRGPEALKIEAAPPKPLPLRRLVIPDKYAIMTRLGLTIAINGRPPRLVAFLRPPSAGDASP